MKKNIGFLSNKLTLRGTEIALYDYADLNEKLLGNKSIIISRDFHKVKHERDVNEEAYRKFQKRFPIVEYFRTIKDIDNIVVKHKITHLYIIKGGWNDGLMTRMCPNLIHCVFHTLAPHGQVYASVSNHLNLLQNTPHVPVVPHMIRIFDTDMDLRKEWLIPTEDIVFGNYGGADSFNLVFVQETVKRVVRETSNIWFVFLNVHRFDNHPRVLFHPGTTDMQRKRQFINTCDAFLHAREGGETFGLACGEFAVCRKPVITYGESPERNHIDLLQEKAILYHNADQLHHILTDYFPGKAASLRESMENNGYMEFTPEKVMGIFRRVFLLTREEREMEERKASEEEDKEEKGKTTYVYFHGFWHGFLERTNSCTVDTFLRILKKTNKFGHDIRETTIGQDADVLVESVFSPPSSSLVNIKRWKATIHFSGEPYDFQNVVPYMAVLKSNVTDLSTKTVYFPQFAYYLEEHGGIETVLSRRCMPRTRIPPKFCCFIVSNPKNPIRNQMFRVLNQYKRVDSCGQYMNNIGGAIPFAYNSPQFLQFISQYKFIICFENSKKNTYITEKPINAFLSRVVPIYWGTHYAKEIFNMDAMVFLEGESHRDFYNVVRKVVALDQNDDEYLRMVNAASPFRKTPYDIDQVVADLNALLP